MSFQDMADRASEITRDVYKEPVAVTYEPYSGAPSYEVAGIFDEAYQVSDPATGLPVSDVAPVLSVILSDLSALPAERDVAVIRGTRYLVVEAKEDGHGNADLTLHRE